MEQFGARLTGGRVPPRLAAAAAGAALLVSVPLVLTTAGDEPGTSSTAEQSRRSLALPWWEESGSPRPSASMSGTTGDSPSDTYLIVGPVVEASPPRGAAKPRTSAPHRSSAPATPSAPAKTVAPAPRPAPGPTFSALAGKSCPQDASKGYQRIGPYTDGSRGWYSRSSGGWTGDGCGGDFDAVPMSGYADRDDTSAFTVWWFRTGAVRQGSCAISVYVPSSSDWRDVAGNPAYYNVIAGKDDYRRVSGFRIYQTASRGSWVSAGSYPVRDGQIGVQMITRGQDPNQEHLAAGQLKVACRAG
jgi:translation initiation factor IF-2